MAGVWVFSSRPEAAAWVAVIWFKASTVSMYSILAFRYVAISGAGQYRRLILLKQLAGRVLGEQLQPVCSDEHRGLERRVFAPATALGGLGVFELVSNLHLMALADLADIEDHFHLAFFAVVHYRPGDGGERFSKLLGENAGVEIGDKFAGICLFHAVSSFNWFAAW